MRKKYQVVKQRQSYRYFELNRVVMSRMVIGAFVGYELVAGYGQRNELAVFQGHLPLLGLFTHWIDQVYELEAASLESPS